MSESKFSFNQRGALGGKEKGPKIVFGSSPIVDLTPPRSKEDREKRELKRRWIFAVIAVAALVAVSIVAGITMRFAAKSSYDAEVDSQKELTAALAEYDEVSETLEARADLTVKKTQALKGQVTWDPAISQLLEALPDDVQLTGYTGFVGGDATTKGRLVIVAQVSSERDISYSEVLSIFSGIENVTEVQVGDLTSTREELESGAVVYRYTYPVAFAYDESIFVNQPPAADASATPTATPEEN